MQAAGAQVPVPKPKPDTAAKRDTTAKRADSTFAIPVPQRADTLLRDTLAKRDSTKGPIVKKDTIKAPLAHAEMPAELSIGRTLYWSRDSLFATGAVTLADLLERIPGLTTLHAGWISSPAVGAYMGDIRRVRVFYDGFEYTGLDPRNQGVLDLTQVSLWSVEDAKIEVTATEVRVYLRSWRVRNTTPETRTDVSTGDQETNLYRGFFGKRLDNGLAVQFAAQQYGTTPPNLLGSSADQTGVLGRVGWANSRMSFDAFLSHIGRHRGVILQAPTGDQFGIPVSGDSIPSVNSTRSESYLRFGIGDPDDSPRWLQLMAVGSKYVYTGIRTLTIPNPLNPVDSAFNNTPLDTNVFRSQYIATGGVNLGPLRVSASDRIFAEGGRRINSPSVRGSYVVGRFGLSAFSQARDADSISRSDITAQFAPLSFINLLASAGRATDSRVRDSSYSASYLRAEAGVRVKKLWFIGGVLRRDSVRLSPPTIYSNSFVPAVDATPAATGATLAIRGQLWKFIQADAWAVRWSDTAGFYRPRYQTRSELFVRTNMLKRFPTNDFGLMFSVIHEYRSNVHFPMGDSVGTALGYRTISTLLEIRILSATISWQFRNLLGERYNQVPGYLMPRQTNFYGVRWSFFD